jgi:heme a synthase
MRLIRRLSIASLLATLVLVTIGGLVRATKSGMGCGTDWPHCSGRLVPALENRAVIIEYSHRIAAAIVVLLLAGLAVAAWRERRSSRAVAWGALGAFALVLFQAILGAVVVKLELEAVSVVLHLATAMALLAVLVYTTSAARGGAPEPSDPSLGRQAKLAAGAVLLLLMVGSLVSGRDAGLAFGDWPLMGGRVVPDLAVESNAVHFLHRVLALGVGGIVGVVALRHIRRKREMPVKARLAHIALGAFAVEVLVGAANVWTELDAGVVTLHLLLGAVIWVALIGLAAEGRATAAAPRADRALERPRAAMESR